ncbi:unnamed protein product [Peronospora belbahrii]|uniref:Uncharacterized protein n=1 Tax=Peronospora belbahrii TaxID=622444 RepID=A0AAU9L529_9STRA|nr:unnamed protein product [Peronospora belbahrii]
MTPSDSVDHLDCLGHCSVHQTGRSINPFQVEIITGQLFYDQEPAGYQTMAAGTSPDCACVFPASGLVCATGGGLSALRRGQKPGDLGGNPLPMDFWRPSALAPSSRCTTMCERSVVVRQFEHGEGLST